MAEENATIDWNTINVEETISESDQATSEDISVSTPVGKFLCTIVENNCIEKHFSAYDCLAANLKMRIDKIIEIDQPIIVEGKPLKRNGEIVMKKQPVKPEDAERIDALNKGRFLFDAITLPHGKEKTSVKNRRLFVAKKIGIIDNKSTQITNQDWLNAVGRQVIVETEHNLYTPKDKEGNITGEPKDLPRVAWSGYSSAAQAGYVAAGGGVASAGTGGGEAGDTSFNVEEFDI